MTHSDKTFYATMFVITVTIGYAFLMWYTTSLFYELKSPTPCQSCAPDPVLVQEELNPTIYEPTVEDIIEAQGARLGLSDSEVQRFKAISYCESTNDPKAVSTGGGNHGLFQLNVIHDWDRDKVYDAQYNTWYAMSVVYQKQRFNAWPNC